MGTGVKTHFPQMRVLERNFLDDFQSLVIGSRWLLVAAETIEVLFQFLEHRRMLDPGGDLVLLLLCLYNAVTLVIVHRVPIRRLPMFALVALDLAFVGAAAVVTGAVNSPFLGQCFLIIFIASLFYGFKGGVVMGVLSSVMASLLVLPDPPDLIVHLRELVPFFLVAGVLNGSLVGHLERWFRRYRKSEAQARERDLETQVAMKEMELARSIQLAALPSVPPPIPGLDLACRSEFAQHVGGDFYMFLQNGERVQVVIGDVAGKGIPAALISNSIVHLLPWLNPLADPVAALRNLNQEMNERLPEDAFVTMTLAEISLVVGAVRVWAAGHPPALLWRAREGRVQTMRVFNPILGFFPDWEAHEEQWPFDEGDVLLLYSDGLIETRNADRKQFYMSQAAQALAESAGNSAEAIALHMVEAVNTWGVPTDDLTILVCKRVPMVQPAPSAVGEARQPSAVPAGASLKP